MDSQKFHWKGRFVSKKKYENLLRLSKSARINKIRVQQNENNTNEKSNVDVTSKYSVKGDRIINFDHLAKGLHCAVCQERLHLDQVVDETIYGSGSYFKIKCEKCAHINPVESGPTHLIPGNSKKTFVANTKISLGALHAGMGFTQTDKFLSTLEVPILSKNNFKANERLVGPFIEQIAKESCIHAVELERFSTLENLGKLKKKFKVLPVIS